MNASTMPSGLPPEQLPSSGNQLPMPQDIKMFPDGSGVLPMQPEVAEALSLNDQENIIDQVDAGELAMMANQIYKLVEDDDLSYEPMRKQANKFIELFGLTNSSGSLQPLLHEGNDPEIKSTPLIKTFTNLVLSVGKQLFPLDGLTDTQIQGKSSQFGEERAQVKKEFANDYFDTHLKDFREEAYRVIAWAFVFGYGVKKVYIDPITLKPTAKFVQNNDFIIHYDHSSCFSAQRKTHRIHLTQREYALRCLNGFYKNVAELNDDTYQSDPINMALQKTEAVNIDNSKEENKTYEVWETECDYKLRSYAGAEGYDVPLTYVLTLDKKTHKPIRLVPNWHKNDPLKKSLSPYIIYALVPFLSGLGIGLIQLCGAAATCSSDILQLLIRAGEFATEPAGIVNSGVRVTQTDLGKMIPGRFQTIMTSGPLQDNFTQINSKEPSPTLKEVKDSLDDYILSWSSLTADQLSKLTDQAAVTIMSLLVEIQKTPNALLERFYQAFTEELRLFNELFYEWLGANESYEFIGPNGIQNVTQKDFLRYPLTAPDGQEIPVIKLVPAADPSMKNATYRLLEAEVVMGHAMQQPQLFNMPEVMKFVLGNMGLGENLITNLLAPPPEAPLPPPPLDPITENQNLLAGKPVKAYPFQDQQAYITVNSLLLNYPDPQIVANTQALIHERHGFILLNQFQQIVQQPMPQDPAQLPPEQQNQLALMAANSVKQGLLTTPGGQPHPQIDPKTQVQLKKIENDREIAEGKNQIEEKRIDTDLRIEQLKAEASERKAAQELQEAQLKYAMEQNKFEHQRQIESLENAMKLKLDHEKSERDNLQATLAQEKHERENLTAVVNLLRSEIDRVTLKSTDKKET